MSNKWTENQRKAVDARGMQVLVSAAAGSGKTTVLTERVKNILCDTENPCKVSELLVVTFTRAAATEMRDRIQNALREAVKSDKANSDYLRRQMILMPTADICTIDSFCAKIVRENFSLAGVGVDFKILDEKDIAEMTDEALKSVIDGLYEENDEAFKALTTMFLSERDDKLLGDVIKTLYNYSRSYPSPENWLKNISESFNPAKAPGETVWADVVYKFVGMFADFHYKRLMRCVALMEESGGFSPDYLLRFTATAERINALKTSADNKNWDAMVAVIRDGLIEKIAARNTKVDEKLKKLTQDVFAELEDDAAGLVKRTLPTSAEHKADCERLYPIVKKLCEAVTRLTEDLDSRKNEKNSYGFDDILHKCIDLLVEFNGDSWSPTAIAKKLREKYKEILIDEYQDTNEAQNIIFEVLSQDCKNLYCVGDVKQSIYRFRLASPELFMNLRRNLPDYDGELHPSQITLDKNFRSRKGIDEAVNFVFSRLMSEQVGEIDYNEREALSFGADYYPEKNTPDTELVCIDAEGLKSAEASELEAAHIAKHIKGILDSKALITTKSGQRPVQSSDICILLRSVKNKVNIYSEALEKLGIPTAAVCEGDTSEAKEIRFMVSLMNVINNPLMDIYLIAVFMSPVFGFTADELAEIRMEDRKAELYICLERYAEKSEKARCFLEKLKLYRNVATSLPVDEFVKFVVNDTSVTDIYTATGDGDNRRANIRGFVKFAEDYTNSGRKGLGAFIRYIDNAVQNESLRAYGVSDSQGVKIMSIHKSKGLEFPYVIVANCSKGFNKQDSHQSLTLARETGIGLRIRDDELFTRYHTVSSAATEKAILFGSASEELRVLYVAMTRAKEHLTFVCTLKGKSVAKRVRMNNMLSFDNRERLHPYAVYRASSMNEWLLTCFATHKDCGDVREVFDFDCSRFTGDSFGIDTKYIDSSIDEDATEVAVNEEKALPDSEIARLIRERAESRYTCDCSGILAKITASSTENTQKKREYFAKRKPAFLNADFTGADRGNAIHKFLELCDFKAAFNSPENEKQRLLNNGGMTEKELVVLDEASVKSFLSLEVGQRLLNADEIYKEYEFSYLKKAGELYEGVSELAAQEDIVVQGKLDCAFVENGEAVIIDYKSDNITDENVYKTIYSPQLKIYSEALTQCTGLRVKECYIYSFKLNKFIEI